MKQATKSESKSMKPFIVAFHSRQLIGVDLDGYFFEKGHYVTLIPAENVRDAIKTILDQVASVLNTDIKSIKGDVIFAEEVYQERAEIMIEILKNARPEP